MKTFEFTPTACRDSAEGEGASASPFKGTITLRRPTFDERFAIAEEVGLEYDENGSVKNTSNQLAILRKMVRFSEKFYEKVSIERRDGSEKFASFEDLSIEPDCGPILIEAAGALFNGKVEKN